MSSELIDLNDTQKQFSNHYIIRIDMENPMNLHFQFTPNFPFADRYKSELDGMTNDVSQKSLGKLASARFIYTETIKRLSEYFNPLNIGIVINSDMEKMFKKQDNLNHWQSLYAETFKNYPCLEKPSFEEWMSWNMDIPIQSVKNITDYYVEVG